MTTVIDSEKEAKKRAREKYLRRYIENHRIYFFDQGRGWGSEEHRVALDGTFPDLKIKGPNPKQRLILEAWGDPSYEIYTFTGGNRMGKTVLGTIIAICVMAGEWLWSGERIPFTHNRARKVRYVGQDWEEHIKTVVQPALEMWWPLDRKVRKKKNNQGIDAQWVDEATGSELIIMSNKQDAGTHEGWEGDLVVFDEPPKRDIWIANSRGLVDREGWAMFNMTLLKEAWVHREVIKRLNDDGSPDLRVFNVNGEIYDNIGFGLTEAGVEQFARTLDDDEKDARLKGKPSYLSGLIFPNFDRQTHVRKRFKVPLTWIVDIAIDWHPSKAWHILFMATDHLNRKWGIFEIVRKDNYKNIAEDIVRIVKNNDLRVESPILMDPLAKSGSQADIDEKTVYDKLDDVLYQYDMYLQTATKDENSGIEMINNLVWTQSEEPAYFLFSDLKVAVTQHEDWMYKDGKPASENEDQCENAYRIVLRDTQYYEPRKRNQPVTPTNWRTV